MSEKPDGIYIVFDGPPGPESGRFVEVEDGRGHGLGPATTEAAWRQREDGWWELGPFDVASLRSRLERAEGAMADAFESLDCLTGHRCREQAAFLAHVEAIQATLRASTGEDNKEGVIE